MLSLRLVLIVATIFKVPCRAMKLLSLIRLRARIDSSKKRRKSWARSRIETVNSRWSRHSLEKKSVFTRAGALTCLVTWRCTTMRCIS